MCSCSWLGQFSRFAFSELCEIGDGGPCPRQRDTEVARAALPSPCPSRQPGRCWLGHNKCSSSLCCAAADTVTCLVNHKRMLLRAELFADTTALAPLLGQSPAWAIPFGHFKCSLSPLQAQGSAPLPASSWRLVGDCKTAATFTPWLFSCWMSGAVCRA